MMKMAMRIQKNQIPGYVATTLVYAPGQSNTFNKIPYIMAGYTTYDVFIVGASGGKSGIAYGRSDNFCNMRQSGGGGGGCLRLQGPLVNLPDSTSLTTGAVGANGGNAAQFDLTAGNGGVGGSSSFNGYVAYGGEGGRGGRWDYLPTGTPGAGYFQNNLPGRGGNGGGNSMSFGSAGSGAVMSVCAVPNYGPATEYPGTGGTGATPGSYINAGSFPVIGGGCGGGGGKGAVVKDFGTTIWWGGSDASSGSQIAGGIPAAEGAGSPTSASEGGIGGGANIGVIVGGYFGYGGGSAAPYNGGSVAIVIS